MWGSTSCVARSSYAMEEGVQSIGKPCRACPLSIMSGAVSLHTRVFEDIQWSMVLHQTKRALTIRRVKCDLMKFTFIILLEVS